VWPSACFSTWYAIRKQVQPEPDTVWEDDWLAKDAAAWALEKPGIVWYANRAFGEKVAQLSGLKRYGGGAHASEEILAETGKRSIIASMPAHHKGKNLQMFSRNLIAQPMPDAAMAEQLLGRTHRRGQTADSVEVYWYQHCREYAEPLSRALELAQYVIETTPDKRRLLLATWAFDRP
jgi:hypothetical protein